MRIMACSRESYLITKLIDSKITSKEIHGTSNILLLVACVSNFQSQINV